jgi:hypothetical protein
MGSAELEKKVGRRATFGGAEAPSMYFDVRPARHCDCDALSVVAAGRSLHDALKE